MKGGWRVPAEILDGDNMVPEGRRLYLVAADGTMAGADLEEGTIGDRFTFRGLARIQLSAVLAAASAGDSEILMPLELVVIRFAVPDE